MLNRDDRRAIEGLFDRLAEVERRSAIRDPEAEALIREEIGRQPGAPYYMAQTILVQEQALTLAEERIAALEAELQRRPADLLGGLFGGGRAPRRQLPPETQGAATGRQRGPWDREERGGGGFLAGAAQTALGVTGGILIGNAIAGMLGGGGEAQAAEAGADANAEPDAGGEEFGNDDFGGFDGGDFDIGGDF